MTSQAKLVKQLAAGLATWVTKSALPVWYQNGITEQPGECFETIDLTTGKGSSEPRRARVPPRQIYAFLEGKRLGWDGPAEDAAEAIWAWFNQAYGQDDGTYVSAVGIDGTVTDASIDLYNQAFALLAMAEMAKQFPDRQSTFEDKAKALVGVLMNDFCHPEIGFREANPDVLPLRSNPHMHLFEACLAWETVSDAELWSDLCDEIAELALTRFIDPVNGGLREFFALDWSPMPDDTGRVMEPGHQFEWATFLIRWGLRRHDADALTAARRLYDIGWTYGIDESRGAAFMALNDDFSVRDPIARLWGQTEWIKAAAALAAISSGPERDAFLADISLSCNALMDYFDGVPEGLYKDKWQVDGTFTEEPAPASSLYHIVCAVSELKAFAKTL